MSLETLVNEIKSYLSNASVDFACNNYKQMYREYVIADHLIDLALNIYDYDFIEECEEYSDMYANLTNIMDHVGVWLV